MDLNIFCAAVLGLSLVGMIAAIAVGIKTYRSEFIGKGDALYKKHFVLSPFQMFLIGVFLGSVVIFIPVFYMDQLADEMIVPRVIKTAVMSVYSAMKMFLLDGEMELIESITSDPSRLHPVLGTVYSTYASVLFIAAPVMTASFVLSFIKNVSAYVKYTCSLSRKIYYISELNERSIALATNIMAESGIRKPLVVFFDVFENNEEASDELIDQAKRLGAICFRKDVTEIGLKYHRLRVERRFYFVGENEDENIKQALALIKHCRAIPRFNTKNTQFYVFSSTVDSEVLLDAVDNGSMKVRRVNENTNLIISTLRDKPIFQRYVEADGKKHVNVLILGGGGYGTELTRALAWCGQIPDYRISIHVVDQSDDLESVFEGMAPELWKKNKTYEEGEPYYEITFHSGIDVHGSELARLVSEIGDVTTAFVTLGDDELNVEVAMRLRRELGRLQKTEGRMIPPIYAVVYSTLKTRTLLDNGGLRCFGQDDYGVELLGDMRTRYSLDVIEQKELEEAGMKVHLSWLEHKKAEICRDCGSEEEIDAEIEKSRSTYDKYEYFRRASIATAIHKELLGKLGVTYATPDDEKAAEHNRWNAFMRAEGYVHHGSARDHIAKTHPDLEPYKKLTKEEQDKDLINIK